MCSEELTEELEVLTAILEEDTFEVKKDDDGNVVEVVLKVSPLTASEQEKQYVSLSLVVKLNQGYPHEVPLLGIRNPRGLEDSAVNKLIADLNARCDEYVGSPVLFELIELAREFLTARNVPVCQCIICLNNIQEDDAFMKTECLHFFHKHCLGRYITNQHKDYENLVKEAEEKKHATVKEFRVTCPVCRETIGESRYNLSDLLNSQPPLAEESSDSSTYSPDEAVLQLRKQMQDLYLKQKAKGGIIDIEAEESRYLVRTGGGPSEEGEATVEVGVNPVASPVRHLTTPPAPKESPTHSYQYYNSAKSKYGSKGGYRGRNAGHQTDKAGGKYSRHTSKDGEPGGEDGANDDGISEDGAGTNDKRERNAHRKNHFLNRGKSHHQIKKSKSCGGGSGPGGPSGGGGSGGPEKRSSGGSERRSGGGGGDKRSMDAGL